MEKTFEPKHTEKFAKGTQPKEMTKEEAKKLKDDTYALMLEDIEFMRLKAEYEGLQIQSYENAVMLGRQEPSTVPGLLGLELVRRDVEIQQWLYNFKAGMEQGMKEEQERQAAEQAEAKSTIITDGQVK